MIGCLGGIAVEVDPVSHQHLPRRFSLLNEEVEV